MQAVLFDFDGVIIDSEWPIYESWLKVFRREGQELAVEDYVQCIGSDFDTWSPEKFLEKLTGKTYDWKKENDARQVEIEAALVGVKPLDGIVNLLEWLNEQSIHAAVVSSSTHRWVDHWLVELDLIKYFSNVVCRGDAPRIKPAPDLYTEGAKRYDLVGSECLVIEDSLNGIKAAKAANCLAYAVPSRLTSVLNFAEADATFDSIQSMSVSLKSLFDK